MTRISEEKEALMSRQNSIGAGIAIGIGVGLAIGNAIGAGARKDKDET